jgi:predicted nucleic acid-binding protein
MFTAVTVFERLRGYREAIRDKRPYEHHLQQFQALVDASIVVPFDSTAASQASQLWAALSARQRKSWGDILIVSIAAARQLPICTRNVRDFQPMIDALGSDIQIVDWTK